MANVTTSHASQTKHKTNTPQFAAIRKGRFIVSRSKRRRRLEMRSFAEGAVEHPAQRQKVSEIKRTLALLDTLPRPHHHHQEAHTV